MMKYRFNEDLFILIQFENKFTLDRKEKYRLAMNKD